VRKASTEAGKQRKFHAEKDAQHHRRKRVQRCFREEVSTIDIRGVDNYQRTTANSTPRNALYEGTVTQGKGPLVDNAAVCVQPRYGSETRDYAKHWFTNKKIPGLKLRLAAKHSQSR
jgi:hypothetical protein